MITENLRLIREKIAACSQNATLIAVSKTYPVEAIMEAYNAGQRHFGENKVQELEWKKPLLPADIIWHLIGPLQSNKVAKALECAAYLHSCDSLKLLTRIDRIAGETGKKPCVLIEVNITGEATKSGAAPSEVIELLRLGKAFQNVTLCGLMTLAEFDATEARLRETFAALRTLRDQARNETGLALNDLSMGMSGDFEIALQEGATFVRIGSAIFGARNYHA